MALVVATSPMYKFDVIGGNEALHGKTPIIDREGQLYIPDTSTAISPAGSRGSAIFRPTDVEGGVLKVLNEMEHNVYALEGPSGKGAYSLCVVPKLTLETVDGPPRLGWTTKREGWKIVKDNAGCMWLRYADVAARSHWIAVLEEENVDEEADFSDTERSQKRIKKEEKLGKKWKLYWVAPNAANMDDFERYVLVDVEVVGSDKDGNYVKTENPFDIM